MCKKDLIYYITTQLNDLSKTKKYKKLKERLRKRLEELMEDSENE